MHNFFNSNFQNNEQKGNNENTPPSVLELLKYGIFEPSSQTNGQN